MNKQTFLIFDDSVRSEEVDVSGSPSRLADSRTIASRRLRIFINSRRIRFKP